MFFSKYFSKMRKYVSVNISAKCENMFQQIFQQNVNTE